MKSVSSLYTKISPADTESSGRVNVAKSAPKFTTCSQVLIFVFNESYISLKLIKYEAMLIYIKIKIYIFTLFKYLIFCEVH